MGAVDTTYTFTATDTITSAKMNNIIDQTTMTGDAILGTTLEVASGKLKIRAQGITSNELSSGSVTSNAIADGTIVNADISASAAIDPSKLGTGAITATATVTTTNIVNASVTAPKLSGAQTGTAPIYGARAFGTVTSTGTALEASKGNVSGVSRTGVGAYTVTFTTPMISTSYVVLTTSLGGADSTWVISVGSRTVNSFSVVARFRDNSGDIKSGDVDFSFAVFD